MEIMTQMLRPHDFVLLLKLAATENDAGKRQLDLALQLGLSQGEITKALSRVSYAGLYADAIEESPAGPPASQRRRRIGRVNKGALLEFLLHGLRHVMPARPGGATRGVATAWGVAPLAAEIAHQADHVPVWPHAEGTSWGPAVEPLHDNVPFAALHDKRLYELLALVDAMRIGRARERALAEKFLTQMLAP